MALSLTAKLVRLHRALDRAELTHAFGGAIALAFCTLDPRATHDIDLNIFVEAHRTAEVLAALPIGVVADPAGERSLRRDAQARLWWDGTPVDVFLSNHPFHDEARDRCRAVPFAGVADLPVLDCTDLAVFKAFVARPKDAVDITSMAEAESLDADRLRATVTELVGADSVHLQVVEDALALAPRRSR